MKLRSYSKLLQGIRSGSFLLLYQAQDASLSTCISARFFGTTLDLSAKFFHGFGKFLGTAWETREDTPKTLLPQ